MHNCNRHVHVKGVLQTLNILSALNRCFWSDVPCKHFFKAFFKHVNKFFVVSICKPPYAKNFYKIIQVFLILTQLLNDKELRTVLYLTNLHPAVLTLLFICSTTNYIISWPISKTTASYSGDPRFKPRASDRQYQVYTTTGSSPSGSNLEKTHCINKIKLTFLIFWLLISVRSNKTD
jgi:hypothetical protein